MHVQFSQAPGISVKTSWMVMKLYCRRHVKELQESKQQDIEVFLNSVPLLNSLSREEKQRLASAMDEQFFDEDKEVIRQANILPPMTLP